MMNWKEWNVKMAWSWYLEFFRRNSTES